MLEKDHAKIALMSQMMRGDSLQRNKKVRRLKCSAYEGWVVCMRHEIGQDGVQTKRYPNIQAIANECSGMNE